MNSNITCSNPISEEAVADQMMQIPLFLLYSLQLPFDYSAYLPHLYRRSVLETFGFFCIIGFNAEEMQPWQGLFQRWRERPEQWRSPAEYWYRQKRIGFVISGGSHPRTRGIFRRLQASPRVWPATAWTCCYALLPSLKSRESARRSFKSWMPGRQSRNNRVKITDPTVWLTNETS